MAKFCFHYESGQYEETYRNGYSCTQGRYVMSWDDSPYRREEDGFRFWSTILTDISDRN